MPSSINPYAVPISHLADLPLSDWQSVPGQEDATILKAPRGGVHEFSVPAQPFPSHWRQLFPIPSELPVAETAGDPALGVALGHFTIERRIGSGAMGSVFLAHDERLQRPVAIKVLAPAQASDPNTVLRFQHEAQAAARLDHEHIARVFYSGEERGLHFIAYEYVAGVNLRDLLRQRSRLTPAETVNFAIQIATALRHTSRHGVIHRDIKPSNIIVTPAGRAKLVDLGLAKRDNVEAGGELTVAGTTLGTFDYISPEQARDPRTVDVRSDIYSLGCTMYHLLTGEPPYPEGTVLQKLLDHQAQGAPEVLTKNRRVSPALSAVIRKMMASDVQHRYSTPDELLRDLAVIARGLGLRMVSADSAALVPAARLQGNFWDRNFGWALTAVALLLIVATLQNVPDIRDRIAAWTSNAPVSPSRPVLVPPIEPDNLFPADPVIEAANSPPVSRPPAAVFTPLKPSETTPMPAPLPVFTAAEEVVSALGAVDAARPRTTPSVPAAEEKLPEISIVGSKTPFQSLEQACQEAKDGAIIELAYHGSRGTPEQSLRLNNKKLVIRAAKGFRPRLDFTTGNRATDPTITRVIVVAGGSLQLVNVDLVAQVAPSVSGAGWTLFALERPELFKLDGVTITVVNPKRRLANVIDLGAPAGPGTTNMKPGLSMSAPEILIHASVIRGAASLIAVREAVPARCSIEDTLIAVEESLMTIQARPSMNGGDPGRLKLELSHTTAILGGNLILARQDENFREGQLPLFVVAQNNLISVGRDQPLVDLSGGDEMELRDTFAWSGERNFYHDIQSFWVIRSRQNTAPMPLDFVAWKEYWGSDNSGSENAPIRWVSEVRSLSLQDVTLADIALTTSGGPNPAASAATDGTDLGVPLDRMPIPPRIDASK